MRELTAVNVDSSSIVEIKAGGKVYLLLNLNPATGEAEGLLDGLENDDFVPLVIIPSKDQPGSVGVTVGQPVRMWIKPNAVNPNGRELFTPDVDEIIVLVAPIL